MEALDQNDTFKDACRLCGEGESAVKMHSIFDKNEEGRQILHLIKDLLPIIIYRTDPLSKQICEKCLSSLNLLWTFRKNSLDIDERHKERLKGSKRASSASIQLYLGCQDTDDSCDATVKGSINDVSTSTDDLTVLCTNCRNTLLDASSINELELCTDLHKVIADSLKKNKVITESESERMLRSRRKRSQAFYHELDDSLCSSLTEFTNTESSHCFDFASDDESYDSDIPVRPSKRRRIDRLLDVKTEFEDADPGHKEDNLIELLEMKFEDEVEFRYNPLSLMQLSLNVINQAIIPDYKPDDFYIKVHEPKCTYCDEYFLNSKLLALHEVNHINIELGEKVDIPVLWHESRDDASVRNKWLTSCDDVCDDDFALADEHSSTVAHDSLLIPIGTDVPPEHKTEELEEIVLVDTKPMVNGILLSDYSKEERKAFYATMRVGGVNKKFCRLCRYSFKDNWAIESHYFSSACYYTCRYCGMRFNKQRHRFKEHVEEHEQRGDPLSDKVYAASKLSNVVPKVIQPTKVKKVEPQENNSNANTQASKMRNLLQRRSLQPNLQIKEEPGVSSFSPNSPLPSQSVQTSQSKTGNQAYFCRKCYKVFFKLDEFNIHSKSCEFNQFSGLQKVAKPIFNTVKPQHSNLTSNGEVSSAGRPVRNCVKEIGTYKDEVYIPDTLLKETSSQSSQSFVCFICNTPFPTIYSRNSHMRIHKGETGSSSPSSYQKPKQNNFGNIGVSNSFNNRDSSSYSNFISFPEVKIKQEPLEPEVEIHESEQNYPNSIGGGAVSITPISKNPNQKPTINPNIMKLVQNNPHLTIKGSQNINSYNSTDRFNMASSSQVSLTAADSDKSYKCSNCWEAFSNKSHLYFHKKNQCEGSRFPCPFCKKRFGTEAAYSSHIFYSHPE